MTLLLALYKWRLGVWMVRKAYARDAVLKQACRLRISALKKKILRISPLPATPLSVAEAVLSDAEAQRFKSRSCPSPLWQRFMAVLGGSRG